MNNTIELETLIVDDDFMSLEILQDKLKDFVYEDEGKSYVLKVKPVNDPHCAIAELSHGRYDLGILDYKMPGKDGLDVARHVRAKKPFIPIIIVSTFDIEPEKLLEAGIVDFSQKQKLGLTSETRNIFLSHGENKDIKDLIIGIFNKILSYREHKMLEQKNIELRDMIENMRTHLSNINYKVNACLSGLEYTLKYKYDEIAAINLLSFNIASKISQTHQSVSNINDAIKELQRGIYSDMNIQKNYSDISIETIVSDIVNIYKNRIDIGVHKDINIPVIYANPLQIYTAIQNLIVNAMEARATSLKLDLSVNAEYIIFTIEDNGTGIPPQHLDRIMEPNFSTQRGKNRGNGLFAVLNIMKQHKGFLEILTKTENDIAYKLHAYSYEDIKICRVDADIETGTICKLFFSSDLS